MYGVPNQVRLNLGCINQKTRGKMHTLPSPEQDRSHRVLLTPRFFLWPSLNFPTLPDFADQKAAMAGECSEEVDTLAWSTN